MSAVVIPLPPAVIVTSVWCNTPAAVVVASAGQPGPRGLKGDAGAVGGLVRMDQATPAATWIFAHGLNRVPAVHVFLDGGEQMDADVFVSASHVTITFAFAQAGYVLIV